MTKTILAIFTALNLSYAATTDVEKGNSKLANDMRTMLDAMQKIQKGGFYNSTALIKEGVTQLEKGLETVHSMDVKQFLPQHQKYAVKFAQKRAKMIKMYADDLVESINHGDIDDALEDYSQILRQCTSCHSRIRPR